ncbi:hypothetical protein SBA3_910037 [Candidatus Sulfopaludibacter sp. SbA3]|nr:hypothetical protein SBA3_910037 [Candidatus Sulfopaludibacter sp. SbA3]
MKVMEESGCDVLLTTDGNAGDLVAGRRVQPVARPPALPTAVFSSRFAGRSTSRFGKAC